MFRMLRWSAVPAIALTAMVSAGPVEAQVTNATVTMKSGEKHTGNNPWFRFDKGEFTLRKSLAEELRVPAGQVAYLDFGGTADAPVNLSGSQQAVVLRNGTTIKGQLIELGHAEAGNTSSDYLVIFKNEQGQEQRFPGSQVARVYFAPVSTTGTTGNASTAGAGDDIVVSGQQAWTSTGITVRRGETVGFNVSGDVQLSTDTNDVASAAGSKAQRYAQGAPMPRAFAGALIAKIGPNGRPFPIGDQTTVTMPQAGILYLGINDDNMADNQGEFRVQLQRSATPTRRR